MYERWIRVFIAVAVLATLFLPMTPQEKYPQWEYLYLFSAEPLSYLGGAERISYALGGLLMLWILWAGPLLAPFNVALALCRSKALRILYWVYLLAAAGISLYLLLGQTDDARRLGYVAVNCLVYAAAILEVVFLLVGWIRRAKERGAQTGGRGES